MLCAVYKSSKKAETYLFVPGRDDFSRVPEPLLNSFGAPLFLMLMPMTTERKLARLSMDKLRQELKDKGYYLQLPPPPENLLKAHLAAQKEQGNG